MTTRPQHRRPTPGAHGRGSARRRFARPVQVASVAVLGGLLAAVALQDVPARPGPAAAAPVAAAAREPSPAPAPALDPPVLGALPGPGPTGVAAPATALPPTEVPDVPAPGTALVPPAPAGLDLALHPTDDPASPWVVVNKALPLAPAGWAPAELAVVAGYQVRPEVADPLARMLAAAAGDGVTLALRSAYRSYDDQVRVHADLVARVGQQRAEEVSARPSHSEHQTGLAVDVGSTSRPDCDFQDCFGDTDEGRWVAARAGEFGFVVRYTAENRAVTGYAPEGWHLRWVGTDLVAELDRRGVTTLEEAFGLPGGPDYR
ncbi:D-alanyl-D-alanine carboxypeptidase family protein [Cellulomonas sp. ACRRI]|uniref:D-alanyl-D-alanine carboxypeptidase family protein n=1 Tax=Cellulomonas sp. ACRRI TaxID=2918188 RepID=UPI001EF2D06E|nr:D-alanyl-D-alanine carboxypeptidase family protein [Cellulomonas sp. ACRRI]MCG7286713.1 D-alanyl-D-alanine carboxypeptidase family protein [Cellulomonas sp. ACRRI]